MSYDKNAIEVFETFQSNSSLSASDAKKLINEKARVHAHEFEKCFDSVDDVISKTVAKNGTATMTESRKDMGGMIIAMLVSLSVSIFIGYVLSVRITRPVLGEIALLSSAAKNGDLSKDSNATTRERGDEIGQLAQAAQLIIDSQRKEVELAAAMADGKWDLDVSIRSDRDELGKAFKAMIDKVGETLSGVRNAVEQVSAGSGEIADASQNLSQGATESAASLEEISASATEIGQQARSNAETAMCANQLALTTKDAAEKGASSMGSLTAAMASITDSSNQIAKIIKTIDDIAFQTNILALNAAVEAARAGRHGKGFAVVAEEVRSLAARSAKAARETADLIEGSQGRVNEGNRVASETASALSVIVGNVVKVGEMVGEMAAASNEQAQGIAQISQGLAQIDQVTQQNTATAEETAAAAEELSGQAAELRGFVARFKLKESQASRTSQASRIASKANKSLPPPKLAVRSLPTSKSVKSTPSRNGGGSWGNLSDAAPPPREKSSNEEIISLEDKDFGRY
jgi:methyl-accepting chemotaxis protein